MKRKALLLVNVGTPDKPEVRQVRKYLTAFLNDKRVIDIPWIFRIILVNLIIVPFRAPKSSRLYRLVWTKEGSPLLNHLNALTGKLRKKAGDNYAVYGAMRYGNPSLDNALKKIGKRNHTETIVLPLFPQYASSTTLSVTEYIRNKTKHPGGRNKIRFISQFYDHPAFIRCFAEVIQSYSPEKYDHIVFSYHGLPIRHINKIHPDVKAEHCNCEETMPAHGTWCYRATCYHTTRLLAEKLQLTKERYTVSFQSRFSRHWLSPFTDEVLRSLAGRGVKNVLVVAPSFVADCLETSVELGMEYKKMFEAGGGEMLTLVESLNDRDAWVKGILEIVRQDELTR